MKDTFEVKSDGVTLGKVIKTEETDEGIEITIIPTDEFYKMKKEVDEAILKVKARKVETGIKDDSIDDIRTD